MIKVYSFHHFNGESKMPRRDVTAKLGNMRKPVSWTVYPRSSETEDIIVQADGRIGTFSPETGAGLLNLKGQYFKHLSPSMGAVKYQFPADFVEACKAASPVKGDAPIELL
jgi:hypothetical protein